jgi:hypothetical protein
MVHLLTHAKVRDFGKWSGGDKEDQISMISPVDPLTKQL